MNLLDKSFNLGYGTNILIDNEELNNSSDNDSIICTILSPIEQPGNEKRKYSFDRLNLKTFEAEEDGKVEAKEAKAKDDKAKLSSKPPKSKSFDFTHRRSNKFTISNNILNFLQSDEEILTSHLSTYQPINTPALSQYLIGIVQEKTGSLFMQKLLESLPKSLISLIYSYVSKPI